MGNCTNSSNYQRRERDKIKNSLKENNEENKENINQNQLNQKENNLKSSNINKEESNYFSMKSQNNF